MTIPVSNVIWNPAVACLFIKWPIQCLVIATNSVWDSVPFVYIYQCGIMYGLSKFTCVLFTFTCVGFCPICLHLPVWDFTHLFTFTFVGFCPVCLHLPVWNSVPFVYIYQWIYSYLRIFYFCPILPSSNVFAQLRCLNVLNNEPFTHFRKLTFPNSKYNTEQA
jgi:hypothetical protein